jgi:hypothetical protein
LDAAMTLLLSIVEIAVGAVLRAFTQRRLDRTRIAVVVIRGHPGGRDMSPQTAFFADLF